MQLLFYTDESTSRLDYIVSTLFSALGIRCEITIDLATYNNAALAKINYSSRRLSDKEIWIEPSTLLFERDIKPQQIKCFQFAGSKAFYKTNGTFPFDVFAASFYLISRYEEYLPHNLDGYGRYGHANSIAYKENFLQIPLVNVWLQELKKELLAEFPGLAFEQSPFKFTPTYDIDIAWSYLHKGWLRNLGGALKSLLKGEWALLKERAAVIFKKSNDPFDIYEWLDELHKKYELTAYYFFLLAHKQQGYDRNISASRNAFKHLVGETASKYSVGLHPSWQSGDHPAVLASEIETLKKITRKNVTFSRQHYIRMHLPDTYCRLLQAGIKADYSMGYGSINGFRASYCFPFKWYNLAAETVTDLTIHPFCFMDANSYFEQKYTLQQAKEELEHYYNVTKAVSGVLITIFHNHTLGNKQDFNGWQEMYEEFIQKIKLHDHYLDGLK